MKEFTEQIQALNQRFDLLTKQHNDAKMPSVKNILRMELEALKAQLQHHFENGKIYK